MVTIAVFLKDVLLLIDATLAWLIISNYINHQVGSMQQLFIIIYILKQFFSVIGFFVVSVTIKFVDVN